MLNIAQSAASRAVVAKRMDHRRKNVQNRLSSFFHIKIIWELIQMHFLYLHYTAWNGRFDELIGIWKDMIAA
jgi:hypothetical protein